MSNETTKKFTQFHVSLEQVTNSAQFCWHVWEWDGKDHEQLKAIVINKYMRECLGGADKATIYLYEASDKTYPSGRPMSVTLTIYNVKKQAA
jgi:hypothetical protein